MTIALVLGDVICTALIRSYDTAWLVLLPITMQGGVLIFSLDRIRKEIKLLGFEAYYSSDQIICIHLSLWFGIILTLIVFMVLYLIAAEDWEAGMNLPGFETAFRACHVTMNFLKYTLDLMVLFMFI